MSFGFVRPEWLWFLAFLPLAIFLAWIGVYRGSGRRFWWGLGLRLFVLAALILALAGFQVRRTIDTLSTVFIVDVSDSILPEEQERAEALVRQTVNEMPSGDRAGVILFGDNALVERLVQDEASLEEFGSIPAAGRTNLAAALQLAMAIIPEEGGRRIVILSDGRQNIGQALQQAEFAAAHQIELSFIPLYAPEGEVEVLLESLNAPTDARLGQTAQIEVAVESSAPLGATLRIYAGDELIHSREVRLQEGINSFQVAYDFAQAGFRRFRAEITPDADTWLQNNQATAFTVVHGPARILIVEGGEGEAGPLGAALQANDYAVEVVPAPSMPTTLTELVEYDAVVLVNVPVEDLPVGVMDTLQQYVRDLGKGLVAIGGDHAYGAGGYLRTPLEEVLPVSMEVRNTEENPSMALVLVLDKSGSMGRCHCDNPDLDQTYVRAEVGQPKVDIAKTAVMRAASALGPSDILGVVAFDSLARWAVETGPVADLTTLERSIGVIEAEGSTNPRSGVEAAYDALLGIEARRKHVVLLTDGWVHTGDLSQLAQEMENNGITLSVVAAGGGAAAYLEELAQAGGGRFYPAGDILSVPDLFFQETVLAVGEYIIERNFYPLPLMDSPILDGLDVGALPVLRGYNGVTPKAASRVALTSDNGDPLLASWQYGLGRSVAWMSDLKGQWALTWLDWEGFSRLAGQMVGWALPVPQVEGLSTSVSWTEGLATLSVQVGDELASQQNFLEMTVNIVGPEGEAFYAEVAQVGPGRYEWSDFLVAAGTYFLQLSVEDDGVLIGEHLMGLVVPYSPEYDSPGTDLPLLFRLAETTGGDLLVEPSLAFEHNLPLASRAYEISASLLLLAVLLFPLDVAVRRLRIGRADLEKAWEAISGRMSGRKTDRAQQAPGMARLFQARQRAQEVTQQRPPTELSVQENGEAEPEPVEDLVSAEGEDSQLDSLDRLKAAKRRARRDGE